MSLQSKSREKLIEILRDEPVVEEIANNIQTLSRLRTILFNLRHYPHLSQQLKSRQIDPIYFASDMSHEEMLPGYSSIAQKEQHIEEPDGLFKCDNCDSMKTSYTEVHTLECTIYRIYCKDCGHTDKK